LGFPPIVEVGTLAQMDYFRNFPQLGLATAALRPEVLAALAAGADRPVDHLDADQMQTPRYMLPSAACYPVYRHLRDQVLDQVHVVTTVQRCFRNEARYTGLARLLGFTMREIVFIGSAADVQHRLRAWRAWIGKFAARCGVPLSVQVASDPFFAADGGRARMQQLFPVKEEFVFEGAVAVASVNLHRNFFAERWNIRTADGAWAATGCVAFGLERWLHALQACHGERAGAALATGAPASSAAAPGQQG
jgi:seryl-tRNA synthetase